MYVIKFFKNKAALLAQTPMSKFSGRSKVRNFQICHRTSIFVSLDRSCRD